MRRSWASGVLICWVLSSRLSDNTSGFRSQRNHPYRTDSTRRGLASRDCRGSTEPKAVDLAAKSSSSQLGPMATYVDCGREFEGWNIRIIKIHKHLHRNTNFLSAQRGISPKAAPSGREVPTLRSLPLWSLEAMVLGDNGPLGGAAHVHSPENPTNVERREVSSDRRKVLTSVGLTSGLLYVKRICRTGELN